MVIRIFKEMALELAIVICLADPWNEDEGWSRREDHVVEVRRALGCSFAESPYLAHQLSMFYHR
jgi:hypothetical protein